MSLDVWLVINGVQNLAPEQNIPIREDGQNKLIDRNEWDRRYPDREPVVIKLPTDDRTVYDSNITHNLNEMADKAGIYKYLWRPDELGIVYASELIMPLTDGVKNLEADPEYYKQFNSPNGWGLYKNFVPFVRKYLQACKEYPTAKVNVSR